MGQNRINTINQEPFVNSIIKRGGNPVVVGGSVRDELLNKQPKDIDIMVAGLTIEQLLDALKPYGSANLEGKSFGVIKFKPNGETEDIDIALARTDKKVSIGHQGIEVNADPSISIEDDLYRRDLTINAIAKDINGNLIDPFGGVEDIKNKVVRMVSPESFPDDPLRMMRAIQQASRFNFTIEPNTLKTIKENAASIKEISPERIFEELNKIVTKGNKRYGAELLVESGLHQQIFGGNIELSTIESRDFDPIKNIAEYVFLLSYGVVNSPSEFYRTNLAGDNDGYNEIIALELAINSQSNNQNISPVEARSIAHNMYLVSSISLESQILPQKIEVACKELLAGKYPKTVNELAVNGNDIMATGLKGKPVGDMQKSLLIRIYADQLKNDRETLFLAMKPNQPAGGLNEVIYFTKEQINEYFGTENLNERKESKYKNAKESLFRSKSISKEMKELIAKYMTGGSSYKEGGKLFGLMKPKEFTEKTPKSSGVSLGADKDGFFCYTHRARCHSHPTPGDIPIKQIKFIETTG